MKQDPTPQDPPEAPLPTDLPPWSEIDALVDRALRLRHFAKRTNQTYRSWIQRYRRFFAGRPLSQLGPDSITAFLTSLAVESTDPGRLLDAPQRPSKPPQRANLLLFLSIQDVAHPRGRASAPRSVNVPGVSPSLAAFQVPTTGRSWVPAEEFADPI